MLERIAQAGTLRSALSVLFDTALVPAGVAEALVVVEVGATLRGVSAMGLEPAVVRRFSVSLKDETHPLATAFRSGSPTVVRFPVELRPLRAGRHVLIPLKGSWRTPFGALLIGPDERPLEHFAAAIEAAGAAGIALERHAEREWPRQSRAQLHRERDLLTAIIDALPDPVFITDAHNAVVLHNRRADDLFMTGETDSEGRRRAVEINNLFFSSYLTQSAISGADKLSRELNLVDPSDGRDLTFEVLVTPVERELAGEHASVSVLRDVTDLKKATIEFEQQFKRLRQVEIKSRRERDRLNMILEKVGDPILVTDDRANIILMNREAERLFDLPGGGEPPAGPRREVRANDTRFSYFISDFALSGEETRVAHLTLTDPDTGLEFPAEAVSGKVLNERAEVTVIVSILHDLTEVVENKRLAAQLARVNESLEDRVRGATRELEERNRKLEWQSRELEQSYRLQSQFLASMSHELRTPINSLLGYASLMKDKIYGELSLPQQEAIERMYLASRHLLELVNDILDLAKIEAGKMPVHVESVDLRQLIGELAKTVEPLVQRKELNLALDVEADLPLLATDRTKVKQVVLNLLSNAVKFTSEGGVSVRAFHVPGGSGAKEGVTIEVEDTGIGIAEEDLSAIFDDFRQLDQSATREHGGTGLGLSITRKLLKLLGGEIDVESTVGKGSRFTVRLPLRSEELLLSDEVSEAEPLVPRNRRSATAP